VGGAGCARQELGWRPHYARLEDIIETAWKWTLGREAVIAASGKDRA